MIHQDGDLGHIEAYENEKRALRSAVKDFRADDDCSDGPPFSTYLLNIGEALMESDYPAPGQIIRREIRNSFWDIPVSDVLEGAAWAAGIAALMFLTAEEGLIGA